MIRLHVRFAVFASLILDPFQLEETTTVLENRRPWSVNLQCLSTAGFMLRLDGHTVGDEALVEPESDGVSIERCL